MALIDKPGMLIDKFGEKRKYTTDEDLKRIKDNIKSSYSAFKNNIDRWHMFRNFVFITSLSQEEIDLCVHLKKPVIEFNILEPYVSRLRGQFNQADPDIKIKLRNGKTAYPEMNDDMATHTTNILQGVLEDHIRHTLDKAKKYNMQDSVYTDTLSGGYSSGKVYADYEDEMSMDIEIKAERNYDPTLCGWDPLSILPDKSDSKFCHEIFPYRLADFKQENPNVDVESLVFSDTFEGFRWTFTDETSQDKMLLVVDYYEKVKVKRKIVKLSNNRTMLVSDYNKKKKAWNDEQRIEQFPTVVSSRMSDITTIVRYKCIENQIIEREEMDIKKLPIIFASGNSITCKMTDGGPTQFYTKPFVYHALGIQKFKNFCGQTLAAEIENLGPAKMIACFEGINDDYREAYNNPTEAIMYVYNAFKEDDPTIALPEPHFAERPQIPTDISQGFITADSIMQGILGTFDTSLSKMTKEQASGVAIRETMSQSNATAQPYIDSYFKFLESVVYSIIEMIPLYYTTPRSIPVLNAEGKRSYLPINQKGGIDFNYDPQALEVTVTAGVSFNLQKQEAFQQIIALMSASIGFAEFVNEVGLDIILDNVEIHGIESLRERANKWMAERAEAKKATAGQPNPEAQALQIAAQQVQAESQLGQQKLQVQSATEQAKMQIKIQELEIDKEKLKLEMYKAMSENQIAMAKLGIEQDKADHAKMDIIIDANIKGAKHEHDVRTQEVDHAMQALAQSTDLLLALSPENESSPGELTEKEAAGE